MAEPRVVCWFSCGAASAVATKLTVRKYGPERVVVAYCETRGEHPDNERFLADCRRWFGVPIERLRSDRYADTWDVWEEKRRYLAGVEGALCTVELKVIPRLAFQRPSDFHVFGYTADKADIERAGRFRETYPELTVQTPLIARGLTKAICLAMVQEAGIQLPPLYALGFRNNNCLPCVKATSPAYWALVRKVAPEQFARMPIGGGKRRNVRAFIDEIPLDQPTTDPIVPTCDFLCHLAEQELAG